MSVCHMSGEWSHRGNWIRTRKQQGNRLRVRWSGTAGKATVPPFKLKGKETPGETVVFWVSGTAVSRELTLHGLSLEPWFQVQHSAGLFKIQFPLDHLDPAFVCFHQHTSFCFCLCKLQNDYYHPSLCVMMTEWMKIDWNSPPWQE